MAFSHEKGTIGKRPYMAKLVCPLSQIPTGIRGFPLHFIFSTFFGIIFKHLSWYIFGNMQMLEYSGGRPCSKLWDKRGLIDQLSLIGQICVAANVQGTISKRTKLVNSLQVKWEMQSMAINIRPNLQPNSDVQTNAITHKVHYQPLNYCI